MTRLRLIGTDFQVGLKAPASKHLYHKISIYPTIQYLQLVRPTLGEGNLSQALYPFENMTWNRDMEKDIG